MTGPLLFIAADSRECAPWVSHWTSVRDPALPVHWSRAGKWKDRDVLAIAHKVMRKRASETTVAAE